VLFDEHSLHERIAINSAVIERTLARDIAPAGSRIEIRGVGMMWGLDTSAVDPTGDLARSICGRCFADGLIIESAGRDDTVLKLLPPLNIDADLRDLGLEILASAVTSCLG
jgi:diaminobutyrate-2-oxoglutarate transaminase